MPKRKARRLNGHSIELPPCCASGARSLTEGFDTSTAVGRRRGFEREVIKELRRARSHTQETIGEILGISQPEVSKIERRADMYISTLHRYIEATGGRPEGEPL